MEALTFELKGCLIIGKSKGVDVFWQKEQGVQLLQGVQFLETSK